MAKKNKPIPKTQKEISRDLQEPYDVARGNPNNKISSNEDITGISFNRGTKLSFGDDDTKPFSIGIKDIDEAVFYYFNEVIKPFVFQNGKRINVPIIYANPELWKSYQKDGYYRDKVGDIMLPIIIVKRDNITKDRTVTNKIDANQPNLYGYFQKSFNKNNFYSNFSVLNNKVPSKEFHALVVPDYVTVEYSCMMQTYYMEQLNSLIESVQYASDSYWGNPERYKFRAFIDDFRTTTDLVAGEHRLVKGEFSIRLRGHIIPDVIQKDLSTIKKLYSKSKVIIQLETVSNSDRFNPDFELEDGRKR